MTHLRHRTRRVGEWVEFFKERIEGHALGRPFRAWGFVGALVLGRCPRLAYFAPLGLEK
jgi:hypothetical protein